MAYLPPDTDVERLFADLGRRREFAQLQDAGDPEAGPAAALGLVCHAGLGGRAFLPCATGETTPQIAGLRIHGAQQFVSNLQNPDTPYTRLLLNWHTGTGKTLAMLTIARRFIELARSRTDVPPTERPGVFIVGFTRTIVQAELLRHPELGVVSHEEVAEMHRLQRLVQVAPEEARAYGNYMAALKRRLSDRLRGGYYSFYGYKEFANRLIALTPKGVDQKLDLRSLDPEQAERDGLVRIDHRLLEQLRHGLLVADEVHNVYNIRSENHYGLALRYVLQALGRDAPRLVLMSATPLTGSATEVVDLLNLLNPEARLTKSELFTGAGELRPGALDRIARLAAGRISFHGVAATQDHPTVLYEGETLQYDGKDLPYLKLTSCPMSPLQLHTLQHCVDHESITLGEQALYDMVYPAPPEAGVEKGCGLFRSGTTMETLNGASQEWLQKQGVVLSDLASSSGRPLPVAGGPFVSPKQIGRYSGKYKRMVEDVLRHVRTGTGKVLIYHNRVRMTGALQIGEILRAAGLAETQEAVTPDIICNVCGVVKRDHGSPSAAGHAYAPCRYGLLYGDLDPGSQERLLARYNSLPNLDGSLVRVLVGSRIITEGMNFLAVRLLQVVALPTDIPTLLQVFGRVDRRGSHLALPPDQRNVAIRVYVSTAPEGSAPGVMGGGAPQPELQRYRDKLREYQRVREVEQALRRYAWTTELPPATELTDSTYYAYRYGTAEAQEVKEMLKALFCMRPVWTYQSLWEAVQTPGLVRGINLNPALIQEGNYAIALRDLCRESPDLSFTGEYYVRAEPLDLEAYYRCGRPAGRIQVPVGDYVRESRLSRNFRLRLEAFEKEEDGRAVLVRYDCEFQYRLLEALILARNGPSELTPALRRAGSALAQAEQAYRDYRILLTRDELLTFLSHRPQQLPRASSKVVAYIRDRAVRIYYAGEDKWREEPLRLPERPENDIVVGYSESRRGQVRFKIRPPLQVLEKEKVRDIRSLARGAVCETRPRKEQECLACRLEGDGKGQADCKGRAPRETCRAIQQKLLEQERKSRRGPPEKWGRRWFYLFNEPLPSLTSLRGVVSRHETAAGRT